MHKYITNSNKYYRNILCFMRLYTFEWSLSLCKHWASIFAYAGFQVAHHWTFVSDIRRSVIRWTISQKWTMGKWKQNAHWYSVWQYNLQNILCKTIEITTKKKKSTKHRNHTHFGIINKCMTSEAKKVKLNWINKYRPLNRLIRLM